MVEGRDITTVVCPDAPVRILLTADETVRMARRSAELADHSAAHVGEALHEPEAFALRWHPGGAIPEATPAPPSAPERLRRCRFCGAPLERTATKCPECGEELLPGS